MRLIKKKARYANDGNVCVVDYFQYCFLGKRGVKKKCFVYVRLPLRMFHSLLQNTDNQNVLGGAERQGKGMN